MNEQAEILVREILENDNSGHGMDHIERVRKMTQRFCSPEADSQIADLIALLHDVDDYKLVGKEQAEKLVNSRKVLDALGLDEEAKKRILEGVSQIGFSKRLKGITPQSKEAKAVSDADMCDAMGATGILRAYTYSQKFQNPFFAREPFPGREVDLERYTEVCADSTVNHMFEKILRLPSFMLTEEGKKEAGIRQSIQVEFLRHIFEEEQAQEWMDYLESFLKEETLI